jgi:pimeloyl-ACP methyl ester carboxylesterase
MNHSHFPWLNASMYPFTHRYLDLPDGRMHYVDEGSGEVLLFIHGTPAWSFLYREQIKHFSASYRCIAIDHLGFGLSDKPPGFEGTPQAHSANLALFVNKLGLDNITLVVHDFGGPIGLSFATANPDKIKALVIMNTWLWQTSNDPEVQRVSNIVNSRLGRLLYLRTNFSPAILIKKAFFQKNHLSKEAHRHYKKVFANRNERAGLLQLAKSLLGSSDWYEEQRAKLGALKGRPTLIIWGTKDPFIKPAFLDRWKAELSHAKIIELEAGHFVQEEAPQAVNEGIAEFLKSRAALLKGNKSEVAVGP